MAWFSAFSDSINTLWESENAELFDQPIKERHILERNDQELRCVAARSSIEPWYDCLRRFSCSWGVLDSAWEHIIRDWRESVNRDFDNIYPPKMKVMKLRRISGSRSLQAKRKGEMNAKFLSTYLQGRHGSVNPTLGWKLLSRSGNVIGRRGLDSCCSEEVYVVGCREHAPTLTATRLAFNTCVGYAVPLPLNLGLLNFRIYSDFPTNILLPF